MQTLQYTKEIRNHNRTDNMKPKFKIIETHYIDQSEEFIKLYNQGVSKKKIMEELNIGHGAYSNYLRDNKDQLITTKKCEYCGKTFKPVTHFHKYCTPHCQNEAHNARHRKRKQPNKKSKKPSKYYVKTCKHCGKDFIATHPLKKYCSHYCYSKENSYYGSKVRGTEL